MTLMSILLFLLLLVVVAYIAYWLIGHLPEPMRTPAIVIVTVIALIVLLGYFWPSAMNTPVLTR